MKPLKTLTNTALSIVTILTMMSPVAVRADSKTTATISGDRSSSTMNTISSSGCSGTQKVSGLDAQIFGQITPDHAGSIVCSKSDGFKTTAEGYGNVENYHWTAWYKNKLNDDVDRTQTTGNYHGFNASKVEAWEQYKENIKKLNGGKFPTAKNYTYPTDTKDGKLDFWGDIAGYYSVLGDPQYARIHLSAYQQFSYRVEQVSTSTTIWTDPAYVPPVDTTAGSNNVGNNNTGNKGNGNGVNGSGHKQKKPNKKQPPQSSGQTVFCGSGANKCTDGHKPKDHDNVGGYNGTIVYSCDARPPHSLYDTRSSYQSYYLGNGMYKTITTTVTSYDETKSVKVADANVAANAYATEIAAYSRIALQPGSRGTLTYDVDHSKFWHATPSYWSDGGKETIANQSSYPYSFVSESQSGKGKNSINLYGIISKTDKLYSLIHGYPDITEVKDIPEKNGFPENTEKTCIETDKKTCSDDKTPIIEVPIDIDEDEVQDNAEINRFVHLVKNVK